MAPGASVVRVGGIWYNTRKFYLKDKIIIAEDNKSSIDPLSALCKRRGFIYHSSEIYGGMPGFWDYGPLGCELKQNVKQAWWQFTVRGRSDVAGLDATIIMHPKIWKASGHLDTFADPMTMCKDCKKLMRADQIKDIFEEQKKKPQPKIAGSDFFCRYCGGELTEPKPFNLMFKTIVGPIEDPSNVAYLRPETAQAIFAQFQNVLSTSRQQVPFGIAQMGKSFRNEVTPRNYTFRSREFEQMELEFFIRPDEAVEILHGKVVTLADNPNLDGPVQDDWGWEVWHKYWVEQRKKFLNAVGLPTERFVEYWQKPDELAHYARACVDIEYDFPFGRQELEGIAARSDFDLSQHQKHSGESQMVFDDALKQAAKKMDDAARAAFIEKVQKDWVARGKDALEAEKFCKNLFDGKYVPHVIEPSAGVDRLMLALLCEAYEEQKLTDDKGKEDIRTVLHFSPKVAPIKVAIFPLIKKDAEQDRIAREIFGKLRQKVNVMWDVSGAIGRRYRRQDEAGTPWCITVDDQTVQDGTFTVRDRESMEQKRMTYAEFLEMMYTALEF